MELWLLELQLQELWMMQLQEIVWILLLLQQRPHLQLLLPQLLLPLYDFVIKGVLLQGFGREGGQRQTSLPPPHWKSNDVTAVHFQMSGRY